jgi:hypothetical protein
MNRLPDRRERRATLLVVCSVPPSSGGLVREIKAIVNEVYLPPGYYLDRSDPEVLVLRRAEGEVVDRFSAPGYAAESVEREAWEDYRQRNR